jgi:xylulokinase
MEGAAYETRIQLERIRDGGLPLDSIKAVGGAMESPVWPQIAAEVFGRPLTIVGGQLTAARGAAILAGLGAGLFADPLSGVAAMAAKQRLVEPRPDHVRAYDSLFAKYVRTVELLGSIA